MPQVPGDAASPNPMLGIMLKCISVVVFVGMQTSIKAGAQGIPAGEIVFFRSFFALVPVVIYLAWLGDLRTALTTDHLGGHVWRGVIGVTSMGFGFFALTRLPYPEWITITYGAPLLTVVFAAIFLKEVVWLYRWSAVLVGLIGIMVVTLPKLSLGSGGLADGEAIGIAAAMVSATVVKECVNRAYEVPLSEGLLFERRMFHSLFNTEDQKEGMSAFLEKREAQFRDK